MTGVFWPIQHINMAKNGSAWYLAMTHHLECKLKSNVAWISALSLSGLLGLSVPVMAQETTSNTKPDSIAAATAPLEQEITSVTVFGRLPKKPTATVRRLDRSSAASCAFSFSTFQDQIVDDYLDDVEGKRRETDNTDMGLTGPEGIDSKTEGFRDTSPYGSAAGDVTDLRQNSDATGQTSVACAQSDRSLAAGRNYILRKDKTLDAAFAAYDAGDYPKALKIFKESYAKIGYDEAALMLGNLYLAGQGAPRDVNLAIQWYSKLAGARLVATHYSPYHPKEPETASIRVQAQLKLAGLYMRGVDIPKNPKEARRWYQAAADLNHIPARYVLGHMWHIGYGGAKDIREAIKFYTNAAEYGYAPAQFALASLVHSGSETKQDLVAAFAWYQQAAFTQNQYNKKPHAQFALAQMMEQGEVNQADPAKVFALYKAAAIAGHPEAQNALATYFYTGQLVEKNLPIARKLFSAAAVQRQPDAMFNLAVMFVNAEGGEKDLVKAYVWLTLAGKLGHAQARTAATQLEIKMTAEQSAQAKAVLSLDSH